LHATKSATGSLRLRLPIGPVNVDDLKADRDRSFAALQAVSQPRDFSKPSRDLPLHSDR